MHVKIIFSQKSKANTNYYIVVWTLKGKSPISAVTMLWLECLAVEKGFRCQSQWRHRPHEGRSSSCCECSWVLGISSNLERLWKLDIPPYICVSCICDTFRKTHLLPKYEAIHSTTQCWRVKNSEFIKNISVSMCYTWHIIQHLNQVV